MTRFIFVRHGESIGNALRVMLGHTDLDLSELGYKQARATADALSAEQIDCIYSSDLLRAYNTALPHADMRGIEINKSEQLRELYLGEWEGKSVSDVLSGYGDMYDKDWLGGFGTFRCPNGESTLEAGQRFYNECVKIAERHPDKTILIASHAAVLRSFFAKVLEIQPEEIVSKLGFPSNASYSEAYFENGKFTMGRFSVDGHLTEIGITKYGS